MHTLALTILAIVSLIQIKSGEEIIDFVKGVRNEPNPTDDKVTIVSWT